MIIISPTVSWKWKACAKLLPELGVAVTIGVRDQSHSHELFESEI